MYSTKFPGIRPFVPGTPGETMLRGDLRGQFDSIQLAFDRLFKSNKACSIAGRNLPPAFLVQFCPEIFTVWSSGLVLLKRERGKVLPCCGHLQPALALVCGSFYWLSRGCATLLQLSGSGISLVRCSWAVAILFPLFWKKALQLNAGMKWVFRFRKVDIVPGRPSLGHGVRGNVCVSVEGKERSVQSENVKFISLWIHH